MNSELAPLVVDLDGTLTPTDTLAESVVLLVRRGLRQALAIPAWLLGGKAAFKAKVASAAGLRAQELPYREELVEYLRAERARGRRIVLATAADRSVAQAVATHLDVFDAVIASDGKRNLKGAAKLEAIREGVGASFVYAGDSRADLPIWKQAAAAILVGAPSRVAREVRRSTPIEKEFGGGGAGVKTWLGALRMHQWLKNLLIFIPLLTSFAFVEPQAVIAASLSFIAFSIAASGTYLLNDLLDLESDRTHPRKRNRALASAKIPIVTGAATAAVLLAGALLLASMLATGFLLTLLLYLALTAVYSTVLKRHILMDVLALAMLYTLRIIAGAAAIGVATSSWILAFSVFFFFSLALVKRCSELVQLERAGQTETRGRDYRVGDLAVLRPMGVGAGLCSVVIFGLFVSTVETQSRYESPQLLWVVGIGLIYWIARLWIKTTRGQMHDDPLVFAVRDFGSRVTILAMTCATLAAHFLRLG